MISHEQYITSINKLQKKEDEKKNALVNGKIFDKNYSEALKQDKNILLFFHMNGCDGCNVVEYLMENNEDIKKALEPYIVLKYCVNTTMSAASNKHNVYSYPTLLIIDNSEKVVKKKIGIKVSGGPEKDLLAWILSVVVN